MNCPLCDDNRLTHYASTPREITFFRCPSCELLVQEDYANRPNSSEYGKENIPDSHDYRFLSRYIGTGKIISRFARAQYNAQFILETSLDLARDHSRILDIGGGTGENLYILAHCLGIASQECVLAERSRIDRQTASNIYGLTTVSELDDLAGHSFDIITLHHVLEHIPNPHDFIEAFVSFLKPGGLLFITLPDAFSSYSRFRHAKGSWLIPDHLVLYSAPAAEKLFAAHGFKLLCQKHNFLEAPQTAMTVIKTCLISLIAHRTLPLRLQDGFAQLYQKTD